MSRWQKKTVPVISILLIGFLLSGCKESVRTGKKQSELAPKIDLGATIGSLVEVFSVDAIPVEGYALVGGLNGTGSSECPSEIRAYLEKYILKQLPEQKGNIEEVINSKDTAVVQVYGIMPAISSKGHCFDIKIVALPGTQTTSLEGGWLYGTELKEAGKYGMTLKVLAGAEGPVFIDIIDTVGANKREGYVLGGGKVLDEYKISLALRQPDYKISNFIRNKLNERFGDGTAKAISPNRVELTVPAVYREQKQRFISLVKAVYLDRTPEITMERIDNFVRKLAVSEDKYTSEFVLEAIGNECLKKLAVLLNSSNEEVRLRAARCMLNLGSDQGLKVLREMAEDKSSTHRIEALETLTASAARNDATTASRRLLNDEEFKIRLAAYEQLRKLDDISIAQEIIAGSFYLEQITQAKGKTVYVSRSGQPRVVLFGARMHCRDNIFVQSADGNITINAPLGQDYVSIMRKHPKRPNVILQLKSSFELGDIIRTLCEEPLKKKGQQYSGLGVSYAEMIALLQRMCEKGALQADFHAGQTPEINIIVKK